MALPGLFKGRLSVPVVASPMFLVSGPRLVIETCKSGVAGTFPAANQRTSAGFEEWLMELNGSLAKWQRDLPNQPIAPYGVNLIVHKSNPRWPDDLELCVKHRVPFLITSLGAVGELVDRVHGYGGLVFHDVTNVKHARKAIAAGVDGLIAVCAGAGGHAGTLSPFGLVPELRALFDGAILLGGAISDGRGVAAARVLGADLAYMGTRFINTRESQAPDHYKQMIIDANAADIVYTPAISGIPGSFLRASILEVGLDPDRLPDKDRIDFSHADTPRAEEAKAWKKVLSAGQGCGSIHDVLPVAELCARLRREYEEALRLAC